MFFTTQTPASPQRFDIVNTVALCGIIHASIKDTAHPFAIASALRDLCYFCGWTPQDVLMAEAALRSNYNNVDVTDATSGSVQIPVSRKDSA